MSRIGSRYFKLRTLLKIFDIKAEKHRNKNDDFVVTEERFNEMHEALGNQFDKYFLIMKINK